MWGEGRVFDHAEILVLRQFLQLEDDLVTTDGDAVIRPGRGVHLNLFEQADCWWSETLQTSLRTWFSSGHPRCWPALILNGPLGRHDCHVRPALVVIGQVPL